MNHTRLALLLVSLAASPALAEQPDYSGTLTGDWGGLRAELEDAGVTTEITYKLDVMGNVSGGIKDGTRVLDNLDAVFTFDGEKLAGAEGLTAVIHLLNNNGGRPDNDLVGSAQGINNIEVPRATGKLYQAFLEQQLFDNKLSVLAGLYDVNSEFYVTESSGLFIHSTFGIGTDAAQSGQNGPSIFPFTSVGGRVRVNPTDTSYVQVAVLDGVPGDTDHLHGTHITFGRNDGTMIFAEAGYAPEAMKLAVGGWYYTEPFDHQTDTDAAGNPVQEHSHGVYLLAEMELYTESEGQGLTGFARFGVADDAVNPFDYAWSAGLVYTGLIPGQDTGQLGFGVTQAHTGDAFRQASFAAGAPVDRAETTLELTYSDNVTPWLALQPDVQYVINPGTDKALDNALVLGARMTISF
jgi:porin